MKTPRIETLKMANKKEEKEKLKKESLMDVCTLQSGEKKLIDHHFRVTVLSRYNGTHFLLSDPSHYKPLENVFEFTD
jgi:hypothetical protein